MRTPKRYDFKLYHKTHDFATYGGKLNKSVKSQIGRAQITFLVYHALQKERVYYYTYYKQP